MSSSTYLGIVGGLSWASTQLYYQKINQGYGATRGRQHSAPLLMASVDFQPIIDAQVAGDWQRAGDILSDAALRLERAGAGAILIASNTMHLVAEKVSATVKVPLLNIFNGTAEKIRATSVSGSRPRVGLLGTRYTMSDPFFSNQYHQRGIDVIVPEPGDAKKINEIIFRELIKSDVRSESKAFYEEVVVKLRDAGAEGVILGCTEICLLLNPADSSVTLYDTTKIHTDMALRWLLAPFKK